MQLWEQGKFRMNDPGREVPLPEFGQNGNRYYDPACFVWCTTGGWLSILALKLMAGKETALSDGV